MLNLPTHIFCTDNELKKPMYKNPLLYWGFFDGRAPVLKQVFFSFFYSQIFFLCLLQ